MEAAVQSISLLMQQNICQQNSFSTLNGLLSFVRISEVDCIQMMSNNDHNSFSRRFRLRIPLQVSSRENIIWGKKMSIMNLNSGELLYLNHLRMITRGGKGTVEENMHLAYLLKKNSGLDADVSDAPPVDS